MKKRLTQQSKNYPTDGIQTGEGEGSHTNQMGKEWISSKIEYRSIWFRGNAAENRSNTETSHVPNEVMALVNLKYHSGLIVSAVDPDRWDARVFY